MAPQDALLKVYGDRSYTHVTMVRHQGTTVAFAMDSARRIVYSVLDLAKEQDKAAPDAAAWSGNPAELAFPREIAEVGYAIVGATAMPTVKRGGVEATAAEQTAPSEIDPYLSTTARLTAAAPFHVLSDGTYVVVLRQSIGDGHPEAVYKLTGGGCSGDTSRTDFVLDGTKKVPLVRDTLLCDRFLLVEGRLKPVLEVRYRRSRHATRPESNKDTLGTEDMDERPFYEPTQELSFVRNLSGGRFAAVLVPTAINNVQRWQLFAHNDATGRVDCFNVEQGVQGLFNTQGTRFYTSPEAIYRSAVFERSPGTCPFTQRDLVPVIGTEGYAETALRFGGVDGYVAVGDPEALRFAGKPYALEAWVKPSAHDRPVLAKGDEFALGLNADGTPYLAHGSAQVAGKDPVALDTYTHVAASYDGKTAKVYVNGRLAGSGDLPFTAQSGSELTLGHRESASGTETWFTGDIDEVRIWNRVRIAAEIVENMNHRLVGNESGLTAYYRFDEGSGTTAYDQTDRALAGTLTGDVRWAGSEAAVGDHPGVRRDSFTVKNRTVVSGLSAILYHQQEKVPAGYGAAAKPGKRQARVLLTFAAKDGQDACVAAVDFGVGRDGRLTQVPDVLDPTLIKRPAKGVSSERIAELQQRIRKLEPDIAALMLRIADLTGKAARLAEIEAAYAQLANELKNVQAQYDAEKDLITSWDYDLVFKNPRRTSSGTYEMKWYAIGARDYEPRSLNAFPYEGTPRTWSFVALGRGSDGRQTYRIVYNDWQQDLCDVSPNPYENGVYRLYPNSVFGSDFVGAHYYVLTEADGCVRIVSRRSGLAVTSADPGSNNQFVVQSSQGLTTDAGLIRTVRIRMRSGLDKRLEALKNRESPARTELEEVRAAKKLLDELQLRLAAWQAELKDAQEELARLTAAMQGDDDLTAPMPTLGMDRTGLSFAAGLLDFARGADRPALLDSGTGNVVLYFRGANEQFFAAYYDAAVTRGVQELAVSGGTVSFVAADAGTALENYTITIADGDAPGRCDLTIATATDSETWKSLPRKASQLSAALAGDAGRPVTVGVVHSVTGSTVQLAEPATAKVTAYAHLDIGGSGYAARDEVALGAKSITLTGSAAALKAGDKVSLVAYDHGRATSSRPGVLLSSGSRLAGLAAGSVESVSNGTAKSTITGSGCRWRAEMPGRAYVFDGKGQYLFLPGDRVGSIAAPGDLSLEAWVNPEDGQGRLVHAKSGESAYSLGITPVSLPVRQFDGAEKHELTNDLDLSNRDFTIELWAKRSNVRGVGEPFLMHGDTGGRVDASLHLQLTAAETFRFGLWGDDLDTAQTYPDLEWHHWAAVYVNATREQILYRDGVEVARRTSKAPYVGKGPLILGCLTFSGEYLKGQIDDVRVFGRVRTPQEISGERYQRLSGCEPGLLGNWTFTGPLASPIKGYQAVARVGARVLRSAERFPCNEWAHLAATFQQSWAVRIDGGPGLEVAAQNALDVLDDLTVEAFVQVDKLGTPMGLIAKGEVVDGGAGGVPYQLGILADGRLEFAFAEPDGKAVRYTSATALQAGVLHRVGVVRQILKPEVATASQAATAPQPAYEFRFHLDGKADGTHRYTGPGAQSNRSSVEIGRGLRGVLGEVRLWNTARKAEQLGLPTTERDKGLLARWSFDENAGNIASDGSGSYPAKLRGARWTRDPDPKASALRLYRNGRPLSVNPAPPTQHETAPYGDEQLTLGARLAAGRASDLLTGTLEEVRVWRTMRTPEQILDNMFTRVRGDKQDLLGYWPFDRDSTAPDAKLVKDEGLRANNLAFPPQRPKILLSTAPVSTETAEVRSALASVRTPFHDTIGTAPAVQEYADLQHGPKGEASGVLKRCYSYIRGGRWHLVTGYKVGDLATEWVGQVQFDPQLVGFIEGAPPVPSENLTGKDDGYPDASSVEFTEAEQVVQSLSSSKTSSVNAAFGASLGLMGGGAILNITAPLGVGIATSAESSVNTLGSFSLEFANTWSSDTKVSQGQNTTTKARMGLTGHPEDPTRVLNAAIGRRYVPANTGMALVQSQTADVFALRLAHTGALVAYRMLPNPDIPRDWNIIHFPINPRYVKQGTLDGAVGFDDRGKVTDPDYPIATGYGEYSYFKPRDAYALKRRIVRDQQRLHAFYESVSTETNRSDPTQSQAQAVLRGMGVGGGNAKSAGGKGDGKSVTGFSHRDLVNTYVWTAGGGFFAETTEATDAVSQTTSGSYTFNGMASLSVEFIGSVTGVGVSAKFDASLGGGFSVTRARGKDTSRTFGLAVNCAPSGDLQRRDNGKPVYDAAGKPVLVPGKVDAYRFFTFYLGEDSANFDDFYHKVVDPVWLSNSNAADAAALRGARQSSAKPPCWRILHRVTYVSRVLPPVPPPGAPPLDKAMRAENIDSNYELIKRLEPYVRTATTSAGELATATRNALAANLPELLPHAADIITYLGQYYGVDI